MTTPTIEQIYDHKSIRKYKSDPVPAEMVESIIAAGQRASTSSNLQSYSVVAVTDTNVRDELAQLCGNQIHVKQAPVFLAWCADLSRLDRVCELRGYKQVTDFTESFLVSAVDAALAMQVATLAAESLGLGMCYIGAIRNRPLEVVKLLGLPSRVFPISGMTLGWPDSEPKLKPRLPLRAILHWEKYNRTAEDEALQEYDRTMIDSGIYRGRQVRKSGTKEDMEPYGWLEHSARRVSQAVRPNLRAELIEQGFGLL